MRITETTPYPVRAGWAGSARRDVLEWSESRPAHYGPPAIPTFAAVLQTETGLKWHYGRALAASVLGQIGRRYPEARDDVAAILRAMLPRAGAHPLTPARG